VTARLTRASFGFTAALAVALILPRLYRPAAAGPIPEPTVPAQRPVYTSVMQSIGPALLDCRTARRDTTCHYTGWNSTFCQDASRAVTGDGIFDEIRSLNVGARVDESHLIVKVNAAIQRCKS